MEREISAELGSAKRSKTISRGTPQGGVLSFLLWQIPIDDMLGKLNTGGVKVVAYAGDVVILITGPFPSVMNEIMERTLAKLNRWTQEYGLRLNPKKTELMLFTRKYKPPTFRLPTIDGEQLALTTSTKYLGLQIDHKFNWKICIEECVKKAWGALYACR